MAAKTAIKEPKRSSALVRRETFASYCFLLPSLIFFLGFVIYPMVLCVVTSFFDSTMNRADIFVGLANYKELFTDPIFLARHRIIIWSTSTSHRQRNCLSSPTTASAKLHRR